MTQIKLKASAPSGTVRQLNANIETPLQLLAILDEFFRTCTHGRKEDVLVLTSIKNKKPKDNDDSDTDIDYRN